MFRGLLSTFVILSFVITAGAADPAPANPKEFFRADKVWTIHFTVTPEEWKAMTPTNRKGFAALFGPRNAEKGVADPERDKAVSPFGFEYQYAKANVEIEGTKVDEVGLRFKGNSSFATARGLKKPFKLDFDRYVQNQTGCGLAELNFSNNVMDPGQMRENLAYATFRAAGVPAPRTTYARVYLTVPGKHEHEYVGLYTVVECVDKKFLKDRFGSNKGLLLKPERAPGMPYLGEDWAKYKDAYNAKNEPTTEQANRLIEFTKLIHKGSDAEFSARIFDFMDVDAFLRLAAANSVLANLDSFFGLGHNYYIYLNPTTNKFVWIPWDLDHSFGALGMIGSNEQVIDWSIRKPYAGNNVLVRRLLELPGQEDKFRGILKALVDGPFRPETMAAMIDVTKSLTETAIKEEPRPARTTPPATAKVEPKEKEKEKAQPKEPQRLPRSPDLKNFITKRVASVSDQLAGKTDGQDLGGISIFGRPAPGYGKPLSTILIQAADTDKDGKVSKAEAEAALKSWWDKQKKDGPDLPLSILTSAISRAVPPRPVPGTPPPRVLAQAAFRHAGATADSLTRELAERYLTQWFNDWDTNHDGVLDRDELVKGIDAWAPVIK